jgi:predicted nucleic acid-binding protein
MRAPSDILVVDANILVRAGLGRGSERRTLVRVHLARTLVVSARIGAEVIGRIGAGDAVVAASARVLFDEIEIHPHETYAGVLDEAAATLRAAPQAGNGSDRDAHVLALAWMLDADIWTHDRDFAGTGWPTWSSANLLTALALGGGP